MEEVLLIRAKPGALSLRFFGDDAVVASRPGAKRTGKNGHPLSQVSVQQDGSPFRDEGFPQIY